MSLDLSTTPYAHDVRPDADIRADLDALLAERSDVDPAEVQLLVQDGIVVMLGEVADADIKHGLEEACAAVRGVRELHDQLHLPGAR